MKTLADVRRRMLVGIKVHVANHVRPEATGLRTVVKNQSKDIGWKQADGQLAWLKWPKASEIEISDPDTVTFLVEGKPFVTITFPPPACVATMGTACAFHGRGGDVYAACNAVE